jgi:NADH:ubiquinone oxidoreductase subunit B-like Fe-S oxidoreductase
MRSTSIRGLVSIFLTGCAAVVFTARASAQAPDPDAERARQLVVRIRSSMKEIDTLLLEGAAHSKTEKAIAANVKRLDELLRETESKSQSVVQNIEELIKLSKG